MPNPFRSPGEWLRCALHAHTTESDGDLPPSALVARYEQAGFDVLAITDHWRVTEEPSVSQLMTIPSAEVTFDLPEAGLTPDVLVYGIREIPDDPGGRRENWFFNEEEHWEQKTFPSLTAAAGFAHDQGGVAYLAHPYWTGLDARCVIEAEHVSGLEVYNASAEHECGRGDSSLVWDAALEAGRGLHAIATDDTHQADLEVGRAWTWVRAAERSCGAVLGALREGLAYASAGPTIVDVHTEHDGVVIACSPCRAVLLQGGRELGSGVVAGEPVRGSGEVLRTSADGLITEAVLRLRTDRPTYQRVRVVDAEGKSAWTNTDLS